jgi:hypothetical protein
MDFIILYSSLIDSHFVHIFYIIKLNLYTPLQRSVSKCTQKLWTQKLWKKKRYQLLQHIRWQHIRNTLAYQEEDT